MNYPIESGSATDLDRIICDSYRAIHLLHRQLVRAEVSGDNLAHHKLAILAMVDHAKTLSPSEIARRLSLTRPQLTQFIDNLVERGAVIRVPDENDRRRQNIRLTDTGKTMLGGYFSALRQSLAEKLSILQSGEISALAEALKTIIDLTSKLERKTS